MTAGLQERCPLCCMTRSSVWILVSMTLVSLASGLIQVNAAVNLGNIGFELDCGTASCVCRSASTEVMVNCTNMNKPFLAGNGTSGVHMWRLPSNTTTLILERSDVTAVMWDSLPIMTQMHTLSLHHTSLSTLDALQPILARLYQEKITTVNLQWNQFASINSSLFQLFPSLEYLNLASNEITYIEKDSFHSAVKLAALDLSNNNVASSLAHTAIFSTLTMLRELKLVNCSINTLTHQSFHGLHRLKYLYLDNNQLTSPPVSALLPDKLLVLLSLSNNNIKYLDEKVSQLSSLEILILSGNGLRDIHPGALNGLENLEQIVLNDNMLTTLPTGLQPAIVQMTTPNGISLVNVTWHCDCRLVWVARLVQMSSTASAPSFPRCVWPHHLANTSLHHVVGDRLRCPVLAGCESGNLASLECEWCPPFQKPTASSKLCECMEGFEHHSGASMVCQPCAIGFYKPEVGNSACTRCPENSTSLMEGSSTCFCKAGFMLTPHNTCLQCPADTYKAKAGSYQCHRCPAFSSSPTGSTGRDQCQCLYGLYGQEEAGDVQCKDKSSNALLPSSNGDNLSDNEKLKPIPTGDSSTLVLEEKPVQSLVLPKTEPGLLIAVGVSVAVVIIIAMIILGLSLICVKRTLTLKREYFLSRKLDPAQHVTGATIEEGFIVHGTQTKHVYIRRLFVGRLLGRGAFGQVHEGAAVICQGSSKTTIRVAVKRLKEKANDEEGLMLQAELEQLILMGNHPNIIQLLGSCFHNGSLHIVMELAEEGDLLTYLRNRKPHHEQYVSVAPDGTLTEQKVLQVTDRADLMLFAWHIARGMSHLENLKCIHRDLAARNVLLTAGPVAKLSDFGLSRDVYENGYYFRRSKGRVPYKWLSPEALLWGQYSNKSDVWSYGILLWEITTFGGTPYSGIPPDRIGDMHQAGYRLPQPPSCLDTLYRVIRCCWHDDPRKRPPFHRLCDIMEVFVQLASDRKYLELQPLPELNSPDGSAPSTESRRDSPPKPSRFRSSSQKSVCMHTDTVTMTPEPTERNFKKDSQLELELEPLLRDLSAQWSDAEIVHGEWNEDTINETALTNDHNDTSGYFSHTRSAIIEAQC